MVANINPATPDWRSEPLVEASPPRGFLAGTKYSLNALRERRELVVLLVQREIKARYKDSALGVVWSMLRPLVQLLIFYVAVGKFLGAERNIPEFAVFVFAGLTAWGLFSEVLTGATSSIVTNAGLIKKVYLPREVFPLAATGSALFNFFVQFLVLLAATILMGQAPLSWNLLYVPLALALLLSFSFALGLLFSAINVYFRDMQHLVEVLLLVLFWGSPIVYSYSLVHELLQGNWLEQLYLSNPITVGIMGFQRGMWLAGSDQIWPADLLWRMAIMTALSLAFVWVAQRVFARLEGNFAQEI
jgi:ABC-2 type transport system permease protein